MDLFRNDNVRLYFLWHKEHFERTFSTSKRCLIANICIGKDQCIEMCHSLSIFYPVMQSLYIFIHIYVEGTYFACNTSHGQTDNRKIKTIFQNKVIFVSQSDLVIPSQRLFWALMILVMESSLSRFIHSWCCITLAIEYWMISPRGN